MIPHRTLPTTAFWCLNGHDLPLLRMAETNVQHGMVKGIYSRKNFATPATLAQNGAAYFRSGSGFRETSRFRSRKWRAECCGGDERRSFAK